MQNYTCYCQLELDIPPLSFVAAYKEIVVWDRVTQSTCGTQQ